CSHSCSSAKAWTAGRCWAPRSSSAPTPTSRTARRPWRGVRPPRHPRPAPSPASSPPKKTPAYGRGPCRTLPAMYRLNSELQAPQVDLAGVLGVRVVHPQLPGAIGAFRRGIHGVDRVDVVGAATGTVAQRVDA